MSQVNVNTPRNDGDGAAAAAGIGTGMLLMLVIGLILVLLVGYFVLYPLFFGGRAANVNVNVRSSGILEALNAFI